VVKRPALLLALLALLALTGSSGAPSATGSGSPSAEAFGISVSVPGQGGATGGAVSAPPEAVGVGGSFAYPADGSIAQAGSVSSSATAASGATTTASASVQVSGLSLFGGEITVGSVTARSSAKASGGGASGDNGGSGVSGLVVLGQAVSGGSVPYGSWGTLSVLSQSASPYGSGTKGFHSTVTALVVHLSADHAGAPAGTDVVVGYTDVAAEASIAAKEKVKPPPPTTTPNETQKPKRKSAEPKESRGLRPSLPPIQQIPFGVYPKLTAGGYVFPIYGAASYTNSFGAPRADTGWHHGEDIFAPLGAPILAVASGIVYSVGWNDIGGLRLWLQDLAGNEFYYAHLSAYSPLAVNGTQVRAGDVLGFVGNTGDAEGTPYHLHFEIHPASLMYKGYDGAVAPYPYLNAWKKLTDLKITAVSGWAPPIADSSRAPRPGAILLQSRDISSASGLEPASLQRAMRATGPVEADGSLTATISRVRDKVRSLVRSSGPSPGP
jgi:murein DD-endopeptidase MepM/ murein hydrolase activator NlpD